MSYLAKKIIVVKLAICLKRHTVILFFTIYNEWCITLYHHHNYFVLELRGPALSWPLICSYCNCWSVAGVDDMFSVIGNSFVFLPVLRSVLFFSFVTNPFLASCSAFILDSRCFTELGKVIFLTSSCLQHQVSFLKSSSMLLYMRC